MPLIVLFDIDGTLVLTGGAGRRAMTLAFHDLFGIPDAFAHVAMAGRTDAWVFSQAVAAHAQAAAAQALAEFRDRYLEHLAVELDRPAPGKEVMPGVRPLLDELAGRPDVYLGLVTGNFEQGARLKLEHFDLWRYFRTGAFGDIAHDRTELVQDALARIQAQGGPEASRRPVVVVVGDTPFDVACAVATGARSIAVATGGFSVRDLEAAGATIAFPDLGDTRAVIAAFGRLAV
jgi:phosphoglycolate phosphatase